MNPHRAAALERLIRIAQGDTGQNGRVLPSYEDFLRLKVRADTCTAVRTEDMPDELLAEVKTALAVYEREGDA